MLLLNYTEEESKSWSCLPNCTIVLWPRSTRSCGRFVCRDTTNPASAIPDCLPARVKRDFLPCLPITLRLGLRTCKLQRGMTRRVDRMSMPWRIGASRVSVSLAFLQSVIKKGCKSSIPRVFTQPVERRCEEEKKRHENANEEQMYEWLFERICVCKQHYIPALVHHTYCFTCIWQRLAFWHAL